MWRFIQTLFRRKEIFFLPVIIVPILAVLFLAITAPQYKTEAVAWVETSSLIGGENPDLEVEANTREAQRLTEWLSTDSFRMAVLERASLVDEAERGAWPPRTPLENLVEDIGLTRVMGVRSVLKAFGLVRPETVESALVAANRAVGRSLSVSSGGSNLLHVRYLGNDRQAAASLVEAAIAVYEDRTIELSRQDVEQTIAFYSEQLRLQDQRQREASNALQAFLRSHPAPLLGQPRPADESAQLDALEQDVRIEQTLYENLVRTLESSRVEGEGAIARLQERIRIVDAPNAPQSAGFGLKNVILVLLTGSVIGAMFGAAAILWLTWLDSKIRSREDVIAITAAPVHLQVPEAPGGSKQWPHIGRLLARDL